MTDTIYEFRDYTLHPGQRDTLIIGTPGYAPPEQYGRGQTDPRSDIYSLGVLFFEAVAGRNVVAVVCTHGHNDHITVAPELSAALDAPVLLHPADEMLWRVVHPDNPFHTVSDDQVLTIGGVDIKAIHTPGHAANHICFLLERDRLLFSGDHVMDGSTVVITPLDGDMGAYLASIERLRAWSPSLRAIAPAHGHLIEDPAAKLDEYLSHRIDREAQVLATLRTFGAEGADTAELVAAIYTDVPEVLWPVARFSVWAHLRKLADEGAASADDRDDPNARWLSRAG